VPRTRLLPAADWLALLCLLLAVGGAGCAARQPARAFSDLPNRLHTGHRVFVIDDAGIETAGRIVTLSASALVIDVNGVERRLDQERVRQVQRDGDALWNGLLTGTAIGALGMLLADPTYEPCAGDPGRSCADSQIGQRAAAVGIMAATGAGIDALIHGRHQVYLAPGQPPRSSATVTLSPRVGRTRAGLFVTLDWRNRP
jgi:hypothetical protein